MASEIHAAIDIGTNTVLLLVAAKEGQIINSLREEQRIPRLGKGVDSSSNLDEKSIKRVIDVLQEYKQIMNSSYPNIKSITVTATSAVRDAENRKDFILRIREATGFQVRVLNGEEEAAYTFNGALSVLPDIEIENAAVIDIGGGSTEIAVGEHGRLLDSHSFDMGSVRFTERFLRQDPPAEREIIECRNAINELLDKRLFSLGLSTGDIALVGVAGTVTSLAYMDMGLENFEPDKINGYKLSHQKLKEWIATISETSSEDLIEKYPEVMKGRAEVILAGLLILNEFMNYYKIPSFTVSTGGIRHGTILNSS